MDERQLLLGLSAIIVLGVVANWIAWRVRLPAIMPAAGVRRHRRAGGSGRPASQAVRPERRARQPAAADRVAVGGRGAVRRGADAERAGAHAGGEGRPQPGKPRHARRMGARHAGGVANPSAAVAAGDPARGDPGRHRPDRHRPAAAARASDRQGGGGAEVGRDRDRPDRRDPGRAGVRRRSAGRVRQVDGMDRHAHRRAHRAGGLRRRAADGRHFGAAAPPVLGGRLPAKPVHADDGGGGRSPPPTSCSPTRDCWPSPCSASRWPTSGWCRSSTSWRSRKA